MSAWGRGGPHSLAVGEGFALTNGYRMRRWLRLTTASRSNRGLCADPTRADQPFQAAESPPTIRVGLPPPNGAVSMRSS
jgi:hypothetical protein